MKKNKIISILLGVSLVLSLTGCGNTAGTVVDSKDAVELLEPVNAAANTEVAAGRNLYSNVVYSSYVLPYVVEYSFDENATFDSYGALPGEKVKKGDVLIYSDSAKIEEQIEKMEESLAAQEEAHIEYLTDTDEQLLEMYKEVHNLQNIVDGCLGNEDMKAAMYDEWKRQTEYWQGQLAVASHDREVKQIERDQTVQLYELDRAYNLKQLEKLKQSSRECKIIADMDGYVVSIAAMNQGDGIAKDRAVVAVGDTTKKIIKCEYINKSTAEKAKDMYAFVDGKRYEVEYQAMETEEYNSLSAQGETIYTTFIVEDPNDEIKTGDFAVINLVNDSREDALSVSKSAIHKDETGNYVFVYKDGQSTRTTVELGMSDGVYTEILSGLNEGDVILSENARQAGSERRTVSRGSFSASFEARGSLGYPSSTAVKNDVSYGTTYFVEYQVENYQLVSKGDVLAKVRVESDPLTLSRQERSLQRANERLNDILSQDEDQINEDAVESARENIANIEETIAEIKADFGTTTIRADRSGVVVWRANLEADDIIRNNQTLFYVADEETCYVEVSNDNMLLNFGNEVSISYQNAQEQTVTVPGSMANISQLGLNSALHTESALIRIPSEYLTDMANSLWGSMDGWWNRNRFTVTATIREMENVLIVPRSAVWSTNGKTYVDVVDENGNVVTTSFIAGGFDTSNYWVIEGLEEGMEICLE